MKTGELKSRQLDIMDFGKWTFKLYTFARTVPLVYFGMASGSFVEEKVDGWNTRTTTRWMGLYLRRKFGVGWGTRQRKGK